MPVARVTAVVVLTAAGCLRAPPFAGFEDAADAPPPMLTPFGEAVQIAGAVNTTTMEEDDPSLTADMLELFFVRNGELWSSVRTSPSSPWPAPFAITELNTAAIEVRPSVMPDGLRLYFARKSPSSTSPGDIFVTTRTARGQAWGTATLLQLDRNQATTDDAPGWPSADGLTLMFESTATASDQDLFVATRSSIDGAFTSVALDGVNSSLDDGAPSATADGSRIVFESNRTSSNMDLWEAARYGATWIVGAHLEISSSANDGTPWFSPDGTVVVFSSNRAGGTDDLFMATR